MLGDTFYTASLLLLKGKIGWPNSAVDKDISGQDFSLEQGLISLERCGRSVLERSSFSSSSECICIHLCQSVRNLCLLSR